MTEMTRETLIEQVAFYQALAAEAKIEEERYRAILKSAAGDEYIKQRASPSWTVKGTGVISGRTSNPYVSIEKPADFLAWVKTYRPDQVKTVEVIDPAFQKALLKGCTRNADGQVVSASGDEVAGVTYHRGGVFLGIEVSLEKSAKEAYAELARTTLDRIALRPADHDTETPTVAAGPAPDAVAEFLATPTPADPANPWVTTTT